MSEFDLVYPIDFWNDIAKTDDIYIAICDGWTKEDFLEKKGSFAFCDFFRTKKSDIILDIGCGIGRIAKFLCTNIKHYYGVDWSKEMVKKAREYNKEINNATFNQCDGETLSMYADEYFTKIICEQTLIHVNKSSSISYFKESYRVLKPSGLFVCLVPKEEHYINGFSEEELRLNLSLFSKIDISTGSDEVFKDYKTDGVNFNDLWFLAICQK
jgi:SAM-dependent methyltransferase